jgi:hypothetical protein
VIRDFVNTTDHETGTDEITTPDALAGHLRQAGLLQSGNVVATDEDLVAARRLRAGLRLALEQNHGSPKRPIPMLSQELA